MKLDRRTVLRGSLAGVAAALALPRLEAMLDRNGEAHADGTPLPKSFVVWFFGNGIDPKRWVPAATGASWVPSEQLAPLAPVKDYVSVVTNMRLRPPRTNEPHVNGPCGILTGDDFQGRTFQDGTVKRASIDQVAAAILSKGAPFRSLEVRIGAYHGGGTAIDHISHSGPGTPNRGENDPKAVFGRLFGASFQQPNATPDPMLAVRRSMLDVVRADAKALQARLGAADRARLDQHLTGIRALETRLSAAPAAPTCKKPAAPNDPATLRARAEIMSELVTMALACDLTRVVAYTFTTPASHIQYPDVDVKEDIHEWGHVHGVDTIVNRAIVYFMENFAGLLGKMKATSLGAGNVLDQACVFATSCIGYGPSHGWSDYPLLIAGKAGGALRHPGIHHRAPTEDTASRVPLTILRALDVPAAEWGVGSLQTNQPLGELLV
jgi:hypothetical protein